MSSSTNLEVILEIAKTIARDSGAIAKAESEKYRDQTCVSCKLSSADLVTETDKKVEQVIMNTLQKNFPTHKFIGEETAEGPCVLTEDPTWIVDPIDGTCNFVHGFPFSAVVLGLAINKEVVLGVIYNFFLDQMFTAVKGSGAHLNGKPIHVSSCKDVKKALIITDVGSTRTGPELEPKVSTIHGLASEACHVHGIRSLGSAALSCCMVAQGCMDAYVEYGLHCWDYAAGDIIVREAGGVALYPTGGPLDLMGRAVLVASSKDLASAMVPHIHHCNYPRDD